MAEYRIAAHQARVEAAFERAASIQDLQTQADLARYLCVLVSGFVETATAHAYASYAKSKASPGVARYVERQLSGFTNANAEKLCALAGAFDSGWRDDLVEYLAGERKDAIDSVVANRHLVAHGQDVGITYARIARYFEHAKDIVAEVELQCAPHG